MPWIDFGTLPLWANSLAFVAVAAVVWIAGTKMSRYAYTISERTGIGKALLGLLLLGGITSLPEVAVSIAAGLNGDTVLAVNTLLGGVALQVAILALGDAVYGRDALSSIIVQPVILLQAALDVVLLVAVAAGITVGEVGVLGVGIWATAIFVLYLTSIWLVRAYQWEPGWKAYAQRADSLYPKSAIEEVDEQVPGGAIDESGEQAERGRPLRRVILQTIGAGAAILVAGFGLARVADALAMQTGLGQSFVGAVFVATSTSLPELSIVISAVRIRQYEMAFANIFGTHMFNLALIFLVDVMNPKGFALNEVGRFSLFAALLGITVTIVYLIGLIERKNRAILRVGVDSIVVLIVYLGGLIILYQIR